MVKVENGDTYTITNASRDTTGEYKCSLIDNPALEASEHITVSCKKPKHCYVVLVENVKLRQLWLAPVSFPILHVILFVDISEKRFSKKRNSQISFCQPSCLLVICGGESMCVSATLLLISCICRAVSQEHGSMVNNRDVSALIGPLNHLFTMLFSLFRPRHQFKPLGEYCQECQ